jgi:choline dehydrogenase-like flavoprotein
VFVDFREVPEGHIFRADVCVAGAGAAGITLATELCGAGLEVCLIESGGLELDADTQNLYEVTNLGIARKPATLTRLRFFGGTTNHWTGRCGRLDPSDFQERPWVPDSGWPITREQLDPFYDRAQPMLDLGPSRSGEWIAQEFGVPPPCVDQSIATLFAWQLSSPTRFGKKFRSQLERGPRAQIVLYANVVNIQTNAAGEHVEYVDVRSLSGRRGKVMARAYVLSCGGIENPRLLLLSDGVDPRGVGNAYDLVGRYFMEHLRNSELIALDKDPYSIQRTYNYYHNREGFYMLGLSLSEQAQRREGILNGAFSADFSSSEESATATTWRVGSAILHGESPVDLSASVVRVLSDLDEVVINFRRKLLRSGSPILTRDLPILFLQTEQAPNRDSRIGLSSDRDALGMRRATVNWRMNELDRKSVLAAMQLFAVQLWLCHNARIHLPESMNEALEEWVFNFKDVAHHIGATRMADSPQRGVVDRNCKVHGLDNLFIAGSSVFPTSGHVYPTLTIVALALKLADELKSSLKPAMRSLD